MNLFPSASNENFVPSIVAGVEEAPSVAAMSPRFDATDGKSMLCLLRDPTGATCSYEPNPGPWRGYVDLEHSTYAST